MPSPEAAVKFHAFRNLAPQFYCGKWRYHRCERSCTGLCKLHIGRLAFRGVRLPTYRRGTGYRILDPRPIIPDALSKVNTVLRDFRTGDVHVIDPKLLDLLFKLRTGLGSQEPFQVISGYRSPQTNARLHEQSNGVATHSLHMKGMAIDIRLGSRSLSDLHMAALSLKGGGVGYYPQSDFVHVDVGPVRARNDRSS